MWKSCFTENQIVAMLRARGWDEAADVCRKHRVSEATQYKRKARWRLPVLGASRLRRAGSRERDCWRRRCWTVRR